MPIERRQVVTTRSIHAMGCGDVFIAHITTEHFIRGVITINVRLHGSTRDLRVGLPVLGTSSPRLVIFPAVAAMDIFKIQTKTCVKGLWFACDAIQAKHIVRRAAFEMTANWTEYGGPLRLSMDLEYLQTHHRRSSMDDRGFLDEPPLPLATSSSFLRSTSDSPQTVRSADDGESLEKKIPSKKVKRTRQEGLSLGNVSSLSMAMSNEEVMSLGSASSGNHHGSPVLDSPATLTNMSATPSSPSSSTPPTPTSHDCTARGARLCLPPWEEVERVGAGGGRGGVRGMGRGAEVCGCEGVGGGGGGGMRGVCVQD